MKEKKINFYNLVLLSLSAIVSLKSLPLFAEVGVSLIFFLTIAMICFFIPVSLSISELSSTWPSKNGCYYWIKKAYGKNIAFLIMWAYWMESIIWFPTMLMFIIAMLAHTLSPIIPNLEKNILFFTIGVITIFWILTYINLKGIKTSAKFSIIGVTIGTIIPIILIIILAIIWIIKNENTNISIINLIPEINKNNIVFFSGILLGISGIELISFHSAYIENPEQNIPKATITSAILIFLIYSLASLSISIVVPQEEICLASGVIQALKIFFLKNNFEFIIPFLSLLLLIGALSGMNAWIIGPVKGIFVTKKDNFLPKLLKKVNKKKIPSNLLIIQAIIGTTISICFSAFTKNINELIWIFICLSFQFASLLYISIFLSVIKLRKKYPNAKRPYKVPMIKITTITGIIICIFTFFVSYIQPISINITDKYTYILLLSTSFITLLFPAILLIYNKNKKKIKNLSKQ